MAGTHQSAQARGADEVDARARARRDTPTALAAAPELLASALSRSDAASREDIVARLQAAGGNQEVGRLLGSGTTRTEVVRHPFTATIRSDGPPEAGKDAHETEALIDKAGSAETKGVPGAAPAATGSKAQTGSEAPARSGGGTETPGAAQTTGPPQPLPDIHLPALDQLERCDQLAAALGYSGSIAKGGAQPPGFGVTRSFSSSLTNITFASGPGVYVITATLEHPITYQVRSGTGPQGQTDVGSDTDAAITAANYASVAADLTPNMSDLNGRPPRSSYWSEDLTNKHELVHANDDKGNGPLAMVQVMAWLNTQTVSGLWDLMSTLNQIPGRFAANLLAALSTVDGEKHAYGDGASSYKARADSISAKGAKGDYH